MCIRDSFNPASLTNPFLGTSDGGASITAAEVETADGEGLFSNWAIDTARLASFTTDTYTFSEFDANTSPAIVLTDSGVLRNTTDFSFKEIEYVFTNESATAIPAGTDFFFTFEGIPEPSSAGLLGLGIVGLLIQRRK